MLASSFTVLCMQIMRGSLLAMCATFIKRNPLFKGISANIQFTCKYHFKCN